MQPLPKIVRERLQAPAQSEHPDPNVLAAFSEQSLPGPERALLLEHLARCGDCREVLALALPEVEEEEAVPFVVRRPWLSMPMLRWRAIAAAFILAVLVGLARYRQGPNSKLTAYVKSSEDATVAVARATPTGAEEARGQVIPGAAKQAPMRPNTLARNQPASIVSAGGSRDGDGVGVAPSARDAMSPAPKPSDAAANLSPHNAPPAPVIGAPSAAVEVVGESPVIAAEQASTENSAATAQQAQAAQQSERQLVGKALVGKAKDPIASGNMGTAASPRDSGAAVQTGPAPPGSTSAPRWMINSGGGLQRSYDEGNTWQNVSVSANPVPAPLLPQAEVSGGYKQKTARMKDLKNSLAARVFVAISSSGPEIWAGASGGMLYHSIDAGDHWASAVPSDHGAFLSGDIIGIEFADQLHGKIATSTSETWTTGDGGQHWSKK
jgi:hypothetical protein